MKAKELPSLDILNRLFSYDSETGQIIYKKSSRIAKNYRKGYLILSLVFESTSIRVMAHRVAVKMMGVKITQSDQVDHINGDRSDNRYENLRVVSQSENQHNAKMSKNNTSGFNGVHFHKPSGLWYASVWHNGERINLGCYKDKKDAILARRKANDKYDFTIRHGEIYEK